MISALLVMTSLWQQPIPVQRPAGPAPTPRELAADTGSARHASGRTPPISTASRVPAGGVRVDGRFDEPAWAGAEPITTFTQVRPHEGEPASERTEVRIVYDDDAIYIAARMFDSDASGIRTELARRDARYAADWFLVEFDSYHDHLTSYSFTVNPSAVKSDRRMSQDGSAGDNGWDPVWGVATTRDSLGWTAELHIPFSQLRFSQAETQVWGLFLGRHIERKAERVYHAWSRQDERGWTSLFGHLTGLSHLPQPRRLEVLPYVTAREERIAAGAPGDPFNDGSREIASAGLDLKYGLTSNLTLDATINPDFGQVEDDPAFVNLTAFEQFFAERRPFFVEGGDIFNVVGPRFFYSRRIGRPPQGSATARGGFVDQPRQTTILGAAKLTGRTATGWSVGLLEAATAREFATVDSARVRFRDEVEPFTNYLVARGKRDSKGGSNQVGFIATAVNRRIDDARLSFLRASAYTLGVDFGRRFHNNAYNLIGSLGFSRIAGDTAAIGRAQRSSARYYQRPDADHVAYDATRTSLAGGRAALRLTKESGLVLWGIGSTAVSPGFDLNDAGFMTAADLASTSGYLNRRWIKPGRIFRSAFLGNNANVNLNFDGVTTARQYNLNAWGEFLNYWSAEARYSLSLRSLSPTLTRGGPLTSQPTAWALEGGLFSDQRKRLRAGVYYVDGEDLIGGWRRDLYLGVGLRPTGTVSIELNPGFHASNDILQFVTSTADSTATATYGRRYVFAQIRQQSLDLTTRLNVTLTPRLSIQLYTQPFVATGDYYRFKELRRPRSIDYIVYGVTTGSTLTPHCFDSAGDEIACGAGGPAPAFYDADPDGPGLRPSIRLRNPSFNSRSLRLNAVARWEYRPGSTLFLVWTSQCSASGADPRFITRDDVQRLCQGPSNNVFALKMNYWLSR